MNVKLSGEQLDTLERARSVYGYDKQISVSIEELNELACVLAKYIRYDDKERACIELQQKAVDEVSDVIVVLDHITNILDIRDEDLKERIAKKVGRVKGWLNKSTSIQQTIDDRELVSEPKKLPISCMRCINACSNDECTLCLKEQAMSGNYPYYKEKE